MPKKPKNTIVIKSTTDKGGSVTLNAEHGVWASYAVASVADIPPAELFYAGVRMNDGRHLSLFFNRETNLLVVDVVRKDDRGGNEIVRMNVSTVDTSFPRRKKGGNHADLQEM